MLVGVWIVSLFGGEHAVAYAIAMVSCLVVKVAIAVVIAVAIAVVIAVVIARDLMGAPIRSWHHGAVCPAWK